MTAENNIPSGTITSDRGWHLDKKVPIGIILAIIIQTFSLGWFVARMDSRITHLEVSQAQRADERDRLITMEERLKAALESMARIERQLDRLVSGGGR